MKKYIAMFLAVAMLLSIMVFPVAAEGVCLCPCGCGQEAESVQWTPWDFTEGNAETGHYYLTENFTAQTDTVTIPAFKNVCLDLRGKVYRTENIRSFFLDGVLSVMDSVGGGMMLTTGKNETIGGFAYISSVGELNILSGTIRFEERSDVVVPAGGLIYVRSGRLNISGGTVVGGVVRPDADTNAQGGNIYVNDGAMYMTGGTVTDGMALSNPKSTMTAYQGGNIYAVNGAQVCISGGTVKNGYCEQDGGNIYVASAQMQITENAKILNGHALRNGGNIQQLSTGVNSVTVSGGCIRGGVAGGTPVDTTTWDDAKGNFTQTRGSGGGGNLYVKSAKGTLTVSGGEIDGDITVESIQALTLSGAPQIGLGKANGLVLKNNIKADVSGLTGGEIYVHADHIFTGDNAADKLQLFKGAVRTGLTVEGTALKGAQGTQGYCPHCGALVTWTGCFWKDVSDLADGTHCYMKGTSLSAETITTKIVVDMNGMTSGKEHAQQLVKTPGSLVLLDSYGGGQLFGTGSTSSVSWGGVLRVNDTDFTLLSGTLCSVAPFSASYKGKETKSYIGGVLFASGATTVNVSGGVIRGGVANQKYSSYAGAFGGNIGFNSANGVLQMSAGIVKDGKAENVTVDGTVYPGQGGNIYTPGKTTVSVSGGFLLGGQAGTGGNISSSVVLDVSGGTVAYGVADNGGNIAAARAFSFSDGVIAGGSATENGGNLYFNTNAVQRSITGGSILGGVATTGGNIWQNGSSSTKATLSVENAAVLMGAAATGGNIYTSYSTLNVGGGSLICGGEANGAVASESGGNIFASGAEVTIAGTVTLGSTTQRGGNVYAVSGAQLVVQDGAVITDGYATAYGGNIGVGSTASRVTLEGGQIQGGSARSAGGNICLLGNPTLKLENVSIPGEIYCDNGTVELSGKATVTGGQHYNIYSKGGKLQVSRDWGGEAGVKWSAVSYTYGEAVADTYGQGSDFSGKLVYDGLAARPGILYKDNALVVGSTCLTDTEGAESWFADNGSAVAAYGANTQYIKLLTAQALNLEGGNYLVDLAGQQVAVAGNGTVQFVDSANDRYDAELCGGATVSGPVVGDAVAVADGKTYIALQQDDVFTAHRLNVAITDVVLRPNVAGIYYQAKWNCDQTLAAQIQSCGIGVSLTDIPGADLLTDPNTLYTETESTENRTSVLVQNIFSRDRSAEENQLRGEMPIFAAAYVKFADGTVCVGQQTGVYSLYSFMQTADRLMAEDRITWRQAEKQLQAFYGSWKEQGAGNWQFTQIRETVAPGDDDVLKILMIGQSHAQDTVWMLYDVLKAEMPDQEFLVVDVYRSTNLDEHVANIKNRAPLYDRYANRSGKVEHTPNVTITDVIMEENWDLIVFTEAAWNQTQEQHYNDGDFAFMIQHIRDYATPGYQLGYNATWAQPVTKLLYGADRRPAPASFRSQFTQYFGGDRLAHFDQICKMMETYVETNEAFDIVFHSGTAIQYASETHGVPEAEEGHSYELYRDYTHLSDFGRLMVAYLWYAQIFGLEEIDGVQVDVIPAAMRATSREQAYGDLQITEEHKAAIVASVNYALKNPNKAPEQVIRETAILEPLS